MVNEKTKIPAGYKQSDIGVIPSDWGVKKLRDSCSVYSGGTPSTSNSTYYGGEIPWITSSELNMGVIQSVSGRITDRGLENSSAKLVSPNTLLLALYGATAGVVAITKIEGAINQAVLAIIPKKDSTDFLYHYFKYKKDWLIRTYTQGGQPNLSGEIIKDLYLPEVASLEQVAISSVLGDIDSLIASLEKLLEKKINIKQGTQQDLLSGKRRLPGFSKKWGRKKMKEIGKPYGGLSGKTKKDFQDGQFPYIPFMNVMSNPVVSSSYLDYVNLGPDEKQNKTQIDDLFFNGSSETPEEVGLCSVLRSDIPNLYLNSFCFGFRPYSEAKIDGLFYSYFFRSAPGRKIMLPLAQGATRYNLSKTNFLELEVPYPEYDEQNAIASVLLDMDNEINELQQNLQKYRNLKMGMMQQLLTGKIRLI